MIKLSLRWIALFAVFGLHFQGQMFAQWETRKGLRIEPTISQPLTDSLGMHMDLKITYHNEGPDSLFMFFLVPWEFGLKESEGNAVEPMIPLKVQAHDYEAREQQLIRKLDLQTHNISTLFLHGRLPDSIFSFSLPPRQDRRIRFHIYLDSLQYLPRGGLKAQVFGCTYAYGLTQVIEDFRKWRHSLPTNPNGRRVYAVEVAVPHPDDADSNVTCENVTQQLEEPFIYKKPLDHIERMLQAWEGIGPWTLSRVGEALVLRHRNMGHYYSGLSPSRRGGDPELNWLPFPVEIGIACVKHQSEQKLNKRLMRGDQIPHRIQGLQQAGGEYKTSALDSRIPKVQRMVLRHFKPRPTHRLDPEHDLLLFTWGPNHWLSLVSDDPVTRDYEAMCQFLRQNFNLIWNRGEVHYLGIVGKRMVGMPLDEPSGE